MKCTVPLCWKFNSFKNKYFVVGDDSSEFVLAVAAAAAVAGPPALPAVAAVTGDDEDDEDDEHINDLFPLNVSLVKFSAISDAILVSCGPINACNSS